MPQYATLPDDASLTRERTDIARRVLVEAVLLGVLADTTLRGLPGGLGWTLWIVALAFVATTMSHRQGLNPTREQYGWLLTAISFSVAFAWRDAEELRVANVLGTLVALALYGMAATGLPSASLAFARIRDVIMAGIFTVRDLIIGTPLLLGRDAELHSLPAVRGGRSWAALRAVLLTIPLVLIFGALFSRADPVFASTFRLPTLDMETIVGHTVLAGVLAWLAGGYLRGALKGAAQRAPLPQRLRIALGRLEVTASLGAVILLFAFFILLQLRWLFGGASVVLATTGLTVAEYARRGFFELVAVAALVLPLILGTRAMIEDEGVARRHQILSVPLLVLLGAVVASALLRMKLYVDYFGLTTDRLYATVLMLWLAIVSLAMARTVMRGWSRPFAAMTVISGLVAILVLDVINPEVLVARVNLKRSTESSEVDYAYLSRLSGDAVPLVLESLETALPSKSACDAGGKLRKRWAESSETTWNLAAWRARRSVTVGLTEADLLRLCDGVPGTTAHTSPNMHVEPG